MTHGSRDVASTWERSIGVALLALVLAACSTKGLILTGAPPTWSNAIVAIVESGGEYGVVRSDPPGIDCGDDCAAAFSLGEVRLTAIPADGGEFRGWSGAGCEGTGACALNLDSSSGIEAVEA